MSDEIRVILEVLRVGHQRLQEQVKADEARSGNDPSFTPDDWRRLGGIQVAEDHIAKAVEILERALIIAKDS